MGRGGTPGLKPPDYVVALATGQTACRLDLRKQKGIEPSWLSMGKLCSHCMRLSGKADGLLVMLGFGVAAFTPASYLRRRLQRPCET